MDKEKIIEEELEYWRLKQEAAAYEMDYWKQKAISAGVVYDMTPPRGKIFTLPEKIEG